ncbi:MAG: hypothetical protein IK151_08790 [Erysipelotrichaceae bacterium]|nr:hypothetical protein [Erysipelotrichaceae bacterium]
MSIFIDIFFVAAPLASLYVLTSAFNGIIRISLFIVAVAVYAAVIYFFKNKIKEILTKLLSYIDRFDVKTMVVVLSVIAVAIKIIFTFFFNYDATVGGDIQIYYDIARQIVETGNLHSNAISHLYGLALHFVIFEILHIPLHIGMFIVFYIGTIVNFLSFKEIIGKNKAFLIVLIYLLMPSSALISFCTTHEIFVYMYVSIFLFFYNRILKENSLVKTILYFTMIVLSTVMTCFVNPGGYIIYIIMCLTVALSNVTLKKKALILFALILCVLGSNMISSYLDVNKYRTTMNTFTILIHGANPEALGEQVDGYPLKQMRMYIYENTLDFSHEGFIDAAKHVLLNLYIYLLTHPLNLIRLIVHKFYILWSGVHYPMELANYYGALSGIPYYLFLVNNTVLYLFMITVGLVFNRKKKDMIEISNYKLEFLGVFALTMLCIVVNKYSIYVTLYVYLIAFYRAEFER